MGHRLWLASHQFTPVGGGSIPTAMSAPVSGTPLDFTGEKALARDIGADCEQLRLVGGYDHNFVLDPAQGLRLAARLTGDRTGVSMEVWTTKPGIQLYTANFLDPGTPGKGGVPFGPRQGRVPGDPVLPRQPQPPGVGRRPPPPRRTVRPHHRIPLPGGLTKIRRGGNIFPPGCVYKRRGSRPDRKA